MTPDEFHAFLSEHYADLLKAARQITGDPYYAQAVTQDALLKMADRYPAVTAATALAFTRRTILRMWWRHLSREQKRPALEERAVGPWLLLDDEDARLTALTVHEAVRLLVPFQRVVLWYRYWADLTVRDTAIALRRAPSTVGDAERRALVLLDRILRERGLVTVTASGWSLVEVVGGDDGQV
jgi:DNA-directed RNA polymerase specialized sigma24 family protein